jgi:hypothetical protein
MTWTTDGPSAGQTADASARMPRAARIGVTFVVAALMAGAAYLVAVRGEALIIDLAALGSRLWCF